MKISDELTKNHREDNNPEESGSMYETGGPFCQVASFKKYLQHSNPSNKFIFLQYFYSYLSSVLMFVYVADFSCKMNNKMIIEFGLCRITELFRPRSALSAFSTGFLYVFKLQVLLTFCLFPRSP